MGFFKKILTLSTIHNMYPNMHPYIWDENNSTISSWLHMKQSTSKLLVPDSTLTKQYMHSGEEYSFWETIQ